MNSPPNPTAEDSPPALHPPPEPSLSEIKQPDPMLVLRQQWNREDWQAVYDHANSERFFCDLANQLTFTDPTNARLATSCADWHRDKTAALRARLGDLRSSEAGSAESYGPTSVALWDSSSRPAYARTATWQTDNSGRTK